MILWNFACLPSHVNTKLTAANTYSFTVCQTLFKAQILTHLNSPIPLVSLTLLHLLTQCLFRETFRKRSPEGEMDQIGSDLCGFCSQPVPVTPLGHIRGGLVPGDGTLGVGGISCNLPQCPSVILECPWPPLSPLAHPALEFHPWGPAADLTH